MDIQMKAITIWQPWATLIIKGYKQYETRHWPTSYRGELAIHAGKTKKQWVSELWQELNSVLDIPLVYDTLPYGAVLGTVKLVDCIPTSALHRLPNDERALGDFGPGRYAWRLENPVAFDEPRPWLGKQGLWDIELDDEKRLQNARERIQQLRLFD